ncbi:hypothetical protein BWI17_14705 [Betaproteobacteria bacterium GR16-43]|nr:hypothetical protein BWI17_14705 [Betaproteobacteria bacterium GR16-43]
MRTLSLVFAAFLAFAVPAAAQTRLWIQSDSGDYIGQGVTHTYTHPAEPVTYYSSSPSAVTVSAGGYTLDVVAPQGAVLGAGPYESAARYPFQGNSPGLNFSGNGRGCNTLTGRFVVLAVSFNGSGGISSLAVDFEQHCEGGTAALWGELRINSALPLTVEKPPGSTVPDNMTFGGQLAVPPSTLVTSGASTVYGINAPAAISVVDGEYSIDGGAFTSVAGTVTNRAHVRVRGTSSTTPGAVKYVTLLVGGDAVGSFSIATYLPGSVQTGLVVDSFPGDYIGGGQFLFARAPDWTVAFNSSYSNAIDGTGPNGRRFSLTLRAAGSEALAVGPYEDAVRAGGASASPGLDLSMDSRGCNRIAGRFVVLEIDLNAVPKRLAVNFEQWCEGSSQPLFGELRMNSTIPYFFQAPAGDAQPDAMGLTAQNPVRAGSMVSSNFTRIYGVNAPVPISISGGGEYSVNGGAFTSAAGTVSELDSIQVRLKASATPNGVKTATLNAGGTLSNFQVRTYGPGTVVNGLYFSSSPGDYVGLGQTKFYPAPPNRMSVQPYGTGAYFSFDVVGGTWWSLIIGAAGGAQLAPGTYENAQRFASGTNPGLDFSGDGRGCNQQAGRFVVHEAVYSFGTLVKFAADFEQHCEVTGPPLRAQVRFNTTVPFSQYLAQNVPQDLSGEGFDDLLWQHPDGRHALWLMNGTSATATGEILGAGTGWNATHAADFDGDGKADVVWQHTDGRMAIYLMNGQVPTATQQLLNAGSGWTVTHTSDFTGDGKADLLFHHTDGSTSMWLMNGLAVTGGTTLVGPGSGWSATRTGDFDGDGKADILWTHTDGRVAIWLMDGAGVKSTNQILNAGSGWSATHVGDLSGDGKADIVWQHIDGRVAVWLMNGSAMASGGGILNAGSGWSVARVADFDGDGKVDLFFQHTDGRAAIWLMDGLVAATQTQILNPASGWTVRRVADLNGDGRADIIWRHTDGRHAAWLMYGTAMTSGTGILGPGTGWSVSTAGQ